MKTSAVIRIIVYCIVIVALLGILIAGLNINLFAFQKPSTEDSAGNSAPLGNYPFATDGIQNLQINWVAGDIHMEPADVSEFQISESAPQDAKPFIFRQKGNTLEIDFCESSTSLKINNLKKDLHILVPKDWECQTLGIDAASTQFSASDLTIQTVNINAASGSFDFRRCSISLLNMDSASGQLTFDGTLKQFDFDGASGEANLTVYNIPDAINMDSMSGKLDITLPSDCGFRLNKDSLGGKTNCDFSTRKDGNSQIHGDGSCRIDVNGLSASVNIRVGSNACAWGEYHENTHHEGNHQ